jgi:hypothetical protein
MFERSCTIAIEYSTTNVDHIGKGKHISRFVADKDEDVFDRCRQLYESFKEKYPLALFPNRKFAILSVMREYLPTEGYSTLNEEVLKNAQEDMKPLPVIGKKGTNL